MVRERPKLLYTVPTFQNPTGRTLPAARRAAVAEVAARRGLWIVEDDPYGELRYEGERVPWIAAHPGAEDRTVLLGSLSKIMAPGLRLGWLRAPEDPPCLCRRQAGRRPAHPDRQPARRRPLSRRPRPGRPCPPRGRRLRGAPERHVGRPPRRAPRGSVWTRPEGGMFLWVRLPSSYDTTALLPEVVRHDVAYVPGAPSTRANPTAPRSACASSRRRRRRSRRGCGGWGRRCGTDFSSPVSRQRTVASKHSRFLSPCAGWKQARTTVPGAVSAMGV